MMDHRPSRKTLFTVGAIVALSTAALFLFYKRMSPTAPEHITTLSKLAATHFESASYTKIADTGALREALLAQAPITTPDVVLDNAIHESLVSAIVTLLDIRARSNADEYAAWMRQRDYTLSDRSALPQHRQRLGRYYYLNPEAPLGDRWEVFDASFVAELRDGVLGNSRPVGITKAADGIEIQYGVLRDSASFEDAFMPIMVDLIQSAALPDNPSQWTWTPEIGRLHWYMSNSYSGVPHWTPPDTLEKLIDRYSEVLCAKALIVIMNSSNRAIPTMFSFYYDQARETWNLLYMFYTNTDAVQGGPEF